MLITNFNHYFGKAYCNEPQ